MPSNDDITLEDNLRTRSAFWNALKTGFYALVDQVPSHWDGSDARLYRHEKQIVIEHLQPLYTGITAAGIIFIAFRVTGSKWYINKFLVSQRKLPGTSPSNRQQHTTKLPEGHLDKLRDQAQSAIETESRPVFDLFLSLLCGASCAVFLSNPSKMQEELPQIPLVPGKSLFHSTICPELVKTYEGLESSKRVGGFHDATVEAFKETVRNCRLRSRFIEQQRQQAINNPDLVPYPGLRPETS